MPVSVALTTSCYLDLDDHQSDKVVQVLQNSLGQR